MRQSWGERAKVKVKRGYWDDSQPMAFTYTGDLLEKTEFIIVLFHLSLLPFHPLNNEVCPRCPHSPDGS